MPPRKAPLARSTGIARRSLLRQVSAKRAAENRQRRKMVTRMFPDGQPPCFVPWCGDGADDLHEPLTRARGGSITDPENALPLCRTHHDMITFRPESELEWAYEMGLLIHSWDAPKAGDAA
jgi:hypothetical protein